VRAHALISIFVATLLWNGSVEAATKENETPPWLENVITGERKIYLIPKGAKKEVFGSQVIVESTEEYVARRIYEFEQFMDGRFTEMDKQYKDLLTEIKALKNTVEQLKLQMVQGAVGSGKEKDKIDGDNTTDK